MEIAIALGSLKVAYHALVSGIRLDQVPDAARICIGLVRTCHGDLEDLIRLRNESLALLEARPALLTRLDTVINAARSGLLEVARLVEKMRPEAHGGATPLRGRLEWLLIDQKEFASQEPLIARQHASVISELNFLRQLVLLALLVQNGGASASEGSGGGGNGARGVVAWDNVALLDEMMGGGSWQRKSSVPVPVEPHDRVSSVSLGQGASTGYASPRLDPPPPPPPPPPYQSPESTYLRPVTEMTQPLIYNAAVSLQGAGAAAGIRGLSAKRSTTFDTGSIALLFGDVKSPPEQPTLPSWQQTQPPASPAAQPSTPTYLGTPLTNITQPQYSPPLSFSPPQQRHSFDLANAKRLSTIPQELIHRYDTYQTPVSHPTATLGTPTISTPAPPRPPRPPPPPKDIFASLPGWEMAQSGPIYLSNNTPGLDTAPTPQPGGPQSPLAHHAQPPSTTTITNHQSTQPQPFSSLGLYPGQQTRPVSAASHVPPPSLLAESETGHHQYRLSDPGFGGGVSTFATMREHWLPERLTGGAGVADGFTGKGRTGVGAGGGSKGGGLEGGIHELAAVVFPADPAELV